MNDSALVICPVYNERLYLATLYDKLKAHCRPDVLFVDDGSTDGSNEIIRDRIAERDDDRIQVIVHPFRHGYGAALLTGFRYALNRGYERVITIDADLQHQPEDIERFVQSLDRYEVVLGARYINGTYSSNVPPSRFLINRYICELLKKYCAASFSDPFCGFRGYRRSFLMHICLKEQSYGICLEMLMEILRMKVSFQEIPVALVYLDHSRKFYDGLNDPLKRINYYKRIIERKLRELENGRIAIANHTKVFSRYCSPS